MPDRIMSPAAVATRPETEAAPIKPAVAPATGTFNTPGLFSTDKKGREALAKELAKQAKKDGPSAFVHADVAAAIVKALNDKKSPSAREAAAKAVSLFVAEAPQALEPILVNSAPDGAFSTLLETFADKMPAVKNAAVKAVKDLTSAMSPWGASLIMPALLKQIKDNGKFQVKVGCLEIIDNLVVKAPGPVAKLTPDIIPVLSEAVWDTKAEVKKAAKDTLTKTTSLVSNKGASARSVPDHPTRS